MYILSCGGKEIVNSEFVERFLVSVKPDATLVIGSYNATRPPVTIGRYADEKEAKETLLTLWNALAGGQTMFEMPESRYYFEEPVKKDARTKRKGGS